MASNALASPHPAALPHTPDLDRTPHPIARLVFAGLVVAAAVPLGRLLARKVSPT